MRGRQPLPHRIIRQLPFPSLFEQIRAVEKSEVPRNQRLGDAEDPHNLADAQFLLREDHKYPEPGWIREKFHQSCSGYHMNI